MKDYRLMGTPVTNVSRIDTRGTDSTSPGGPYENVVLQSTIIPLDPTLCAFQQFVGDAQAGASVTNPDGSAWTYSDAALAALTAG